MANTLVPSWKWSLYMYMYLLYLVWFKIMQDNFILIVELSTVPAYSLVV